MKRPKIFGPAYVRFKRKTRGRMVFKKNNPPNPQILNVQIPLPKPTLQLVPRYKSLLSVNLVQARKREFPFNLSHLSSLRALHAHCDSSPSLPRLRKASGVWL